ncbi:MAG TPA: MgtC/SapB family protein [Candidatus Paceibacterota bacterium]|nr:MgtC/SapB family protein [Candidatus Paceibacterota bacterium]HRZ30026.1 MgtC/SapB family protein [Candidatus Paceibacterota bacterium]
MGGVRTFALISFLGSIAGLLYSNQENGLAYVLTGFIFVAILIYYFVTAFKAHITGLTTEISALFAYLIGFFVLTNIIPVFVVVAFSIILILILSNKNRSKKFASSIDRKE